MGTCKGKFRDRYFNTYGWDFLNEGAYSMLAIKITLIVTVICLVVVAVACVKIAGEADRRKHL